MLFIAKQKGFTKAAVVFAVCLLTFAVSLVGAAQTTKTDANLNQLAEADGAISYRFAPASVTRLQVSLE